MLYIPYDALTDTLEKGLLRAGLDEKRAAQLADVFAGTSADGVYSHGVNRYMRFLGEVEKGIVDLKAETVVELSLLVAHQKKLLRLKKVGQENS